MKALVRLFILAAMTLTGLGLSAVPAGGAAAAPRSAPTAPAAPLVIGADAFTESQIVAELYAGVLREAGRVVTIVTARNREAMEPRLRAGKVQVVPEYIGSFAEYLNLKANGSTAAPAASNSLAKTTRKARALAKAVGLSVLAPARAQNVNAFAVRALRGSTGCASPSS